MPPDLSASDYRALGMLLVGTGLLFMIEPAITLMSPATYDTINDARRQNRIAILWPAGLVLLAWGAVCLFFSIPPHHAAQWCLLFIAIPCIAKGLATLLFSSRLARLSEAVRASTKVRRSKCAAGLLFGAILIGWGFRFLLGP